MYPTLAVVNNKTVVQQTELKRCTTTEIRWNKNEDARTFPVVSANRLSNSLKNWRASLLIGPWNSNAIWRHSPCGDRDSRVYVTIRFLDAASVHLRDEASRHRSRHSAVVQDTVTSHMRDLPARHGINVNPSERFPSQRLSAMVPWTPERQWHHWDGGFLTVLPGARLYTDYTGCDDQASWLVNHNGTGEVHRG